MVLLQVNAAETLHFVAETLHFAAETLHFAAEIPDLR